MRQIRDHYLPPDAAAFRAAEPATGRVIVIAPTRAACETIELAMHLRIETLLEREHGREIRDLARSGRGFGVVAGTGTGKTLAIRPIAEEILRAPLKVGVVNREREATPETPSWNVVIVTTGIARRWFQDDLILPRDTLVVDEIHQTSAELELCLALGKRTGCRFIWLSATVDPSFYARYLASAEVLETTAFDPARAAAVRVVARRPPEFFDERFVRRAIRERRGVAVFVPTRAEVENLAAELGQQWPRLTAAFYHGGEPIRVIRPFLEEEPEKPYLLAMTAAGQSALNIRGLDTVVIYDARYANVVERGRNVLTRLYLGANEILQMAGRVHGRVPGGEVYILSDRDLDFEALRPTPPEFQLAGDAERVALTCAALGVDAGDLDLPVALDRRAYRDARARLTARGLVDDRGHLTPYGKAVEAMPVERPWGELLYHADDAMLPFVAIMANIESLHRMTRDDRDLRGLVVRGSDHLTAYNVYTEAVNQCGNVGEVYGLPRHLFEEARLEELSEQRGVLIKAIEDVALGTASVFRTLERPLPATLPYARRREFEGFAEFVAPIMPFDLVIDEETASGEEARVARSSVCTTWGGVAGSLRYFADRFGNPRASIEGTNISYDLIRRHASRGPPVVAVEGRRHGARLVVRRALEHAGFRLEEDTEPLPSPFPDDLADGARDALVEALLQGRTQHPDQGRLRRAVERLDEYWRRSGGAIECASPSHRRTALRSQLASVESLDDFHATRLRLEPDVLIAEAVRRRLDALPSSAQVLGDRMPIVYAIEAGSPIARLRVREGQARRLRTRDLPDLDRPLHFELVRGKRVVARGETLEELKNALRKGRRSARARR